MAPAWVTRPDMFRWRVARIIRPGSEFVCVFFRQPAGAAEPRYGGV